MEITFHSHANKTHFHNKVCAPSLILKVRVFGTRKWPIFICFLVNPGRVLASSSNQLLDEPWLILKPMAIYRGYLVAGLKLWKKLPFNILGKAKFNEFSF